MLHRVKENRRFTKEVDNPVRIAITRILEENTALAITIPTRFMQFIKMLIKPTFSAFCSANNSDLHNVKIKFKQTKNIVTMIGNFVLMWVFKSESVFRKAITLVERISAVIEIIVIIRYAVETVSLAFS